MSASTMRTPTDSSENAVLSIAPDGNDWVSLSQGQLIWRRFKRSRIALVGGVVLLVFYLSAIFADFIAPYEISTRFTNQIYAPPNPTPFCRLSKAIFTAQPFVYKMKQTINRATLEIAYAPDVSKRYPLKFFVKGDPYKLWGLFQASSICLARAKRMRRYLSLGRIDRGATW